MDRKSMFLKLPCDGSDFKVTYLDVLSFTNDPFGTEEEPRYELNIKHKGNHVDYSVLRFDQTIDGGRLAFDLYYCAHHDAPDEYSSHATILGAFGDVFVKRLGHIDEVFPLRSIMAHLTAEACYIHDNTLVLPSLGEDCFPAVRRHIPH